MEDRTLGSYRVLSRLGAGGMGTVWLAEAVEATAGLVAGDRVALKVFHPHLLGRPGFFKRFLREFEAGRQVVHENVVRTLDADAVETESGMAHFLVTEYVEGETLRQLLSDLGTVPEALVREIARQVAAALQAIHAAGIVHRDLKPENVLITRENRVRVMDLGIARLVEATVELTRDGQFAGSLAYAAPEQFGSSPVGPEADLYGLGVLLYELLTGVNPFRADSPLSAMHNHASHEPPPPADRVPEISPFLSELTMALLAKDPARRLGPAAEVRAVLAAGETSDWWDERRRAGREARATRVPVRRETELHGRATELAVLRETWRQAEAGEGRAVLLTGEAGIGKSRLLDAFLREIEGSGARVLYGSYPPAGGLGGLSEALIAHFGSVRLAEALAPHLGDAPRLVPAFAAMLRGESPPPGSEALSSDGHHAAFSMLVKGLAADRPLVWVVEDLHFAEPERRRVAVSMARAARGCRALVLLTSRPGLTESELLALSRLPGFLRLSLGRLSPREVVELLRDAFRSPSLAERLGGKIAWKSDGVPFFVFEMIRGLKEGQFLKERPDGTWVETRLVTDIEVPSAIRDLVEARLGGLSRDERALLDAGAVEGFEFDPELLARILTRRRVAVLQDLAEVERRHGLVRACGDRYRFDHHQIQEVLYERLPPALRKEYHTLLAEAITARAGGAEGPGDEAAVLLATHHLRGTRPEAALPHLLPALDRLAKDFRNDACLRLSAAALEAPGLLASRERAEVLVRRAQRLDSIGRTEEARTAVDEAIALAGEAGDEALLCRARRVLGMILFSRSAYAEAREVLVIALSTARRLGNREEEGLVLMNLGNAASLAGDRPEACDHYEACLRLARERGDAELEAAATVNLAVVLKNLARFDQAHELLVRRLELAQGRGEKRIEAAALGNLAHIDHHGGRSGDALAGFLRSLSIYREIGECLGETVALLNVARIRLDLGDLEGAARDVEECLALSRESGSGYAEGHALLLASEVAAAQGDLVRAVEAAEECLALRRRMDQAEGVAATLVLLSDYRAESGDIPAAVACLREALLSARRVDSADLIAHALAGLAALGEADPAEALAALPAAEPRFSVADRLRFHFDLWRATGDGGHLAEAKRLLELLRDLAPPEHREALVSRLPLHRRVAAG
ncbi:MAG: protein kinase [Planctomycetes bacterium]|jgi:tetratricopeptide (TPR) repeat protein|nr:protein kinase [Planctomycetota bacterium]